MRGSRLSGPHTFGFFILLWVAPRISRDVPQTTAISPPSDPTATIGGSDPSMRRTSARATHLQPIGRPGLGSAYLSPYVARWGRSWRGLTRDPMPLFITRVVMRGLGSAQNPTGKPRTRDGGSESWSPPLQCHKPGLLKKVPVCDAQCGRPSGDGATEASWITPYQ